MLAVLAFIERGQAISERDHAIHQTAIATSVLLATRSELLDSSVPAMAARLAVAAWRISATAEAYESMLEAWAQPERGIVTSKSAGGLAFSPDGKMLAIAASNGAVWLWDPVTRRQIGRPFAGRAANAAAAASITFRPDGKILAIGYDDSTIRLWDVASRRQIGASLVTARRNPDATTSPTVAFSPDGKFLVAAGSYYRAGNWFGTVQLWDVATRRQVGTTIAVDSGSGADAALLSPNGRVLVTAGGDMQFWNVRSHRQVGASIAGGHNGFDGLAISPNGKVLATAGEDGTARLWSMASHRQIGAAIPTNSSANLSGVTFSPDGALLAVASNDGNVRLWDVTTHRPVAPFRAIGGTPRYPF